MTRPIERIEPTLKAIQDYWIEHPDLRLGQILAYVATTKGMTTGDPYFIEEKDIIDELAKLKGREDRDDHVY